MCAWFLAMSKISMVMNKEVQKTDQPTCPVWTAVKCSDFEYSGHDLDSFGLCFKKYYFISQKVSENYTLHP